MLGPLLFLLYTTDVGELAASLGSLSHFYADDSQLYTWSHPSSDELPRRRMEVGVGRMAKWMRSNRLCLILEAASAAVAASVTLEVDRCNSLRVGVPTCLLDCLQSVLNAAAGLLCNRRKYNHVTPLLRDVLRWLPVLLRVEFKICLLVYVADMPQGSSVGCDQCI